MLYPDPIARPLPKPPELLDKRAEPKQSIGSTPNIDFEENSPHQEGIILKGTHLPLAMKEIQARYLTSLYFKDIYKYLAQNYVPRKKACSTKGRNFIRKIYPIGFFAV